MVMVVVVVVTTTSCSGSDGDGDGDGNGDEDGSVVVVITNASNSGGGGGDGTSTSNSNKEGKTQVKRDVVDEGLTMKRSPTRTMKELGEGERGIHRPSLESTSNPLTCSSARIVSKYLSV